MIKAITCQLIQKAGRINNHHILLLITIIATLFYDNCDDIIVVVTKLSGSLSALEFRDGCHTHSQVQSVVNLFRLFTENIKGRYHIIFMY